MNDPVPVPAMLHCHPCVPRVKLDVSAATVGVPVPLAVIVSSVCPPHKVMTRGPPAPELAHLEPSYPATVAEPVPPEAVATGVTITGLAHGIAVPAKASACTFPCESSQYGCPPKLNSFPPPCGCCWAGSGGDGTSVKARGPPEAIGTLLVVVAGRLEHAQMTETMEPGPTYIVAVPAAVIPHTDSVEPCKTICCPAGIARPVTAVTAVNDPT